MQLHIDSEDEDVRHGDREDQAEVVVEYQAKDADGKLKSEKPTKETLVCSCGSTRCWAIPQLGHPRPVFSTEIEPLAPQFVRDQRALALKQAGG